MSKSNGSVNKEIEHRLAWLELAKEASRFDMADAFMISSDAAKDWADLMVKKGVLVAIGTNGKTVYRLSDKVVLK